MALREWGESTKNESSKISIFELSFFVDSRFFFTVFTTGESIESALVLSNRTPSFFVEFDAIPQKIEEDSFEIKIAGVISLHGLETQTAFVLTPKIGYNCGCCGS